MQVRFLKTDFHSAAWNMACDEVMLGRIARGESAPALRLYGWKPKAVSIGFFQSMEDEVDVAACERRGVDVVRRITGGGAVFHDEEITYSFLVPAPPLESAETVPSDILKSYEAISQGVIRGLAVAGVAALFVPLNDLVVKSANGMMQKISGNAQTRKQGVILQHGTVLLKVDVDTMFELLKVPDEKMKGKMIATIKERVTSVSDFLGREAGFGEMELALGKGFAEAFPQLHFEDSTLSSEEKTAIEKLAAEKYSSREWNFKR